MRDRRTMRNSGAVYVEFLVVIIPFLTLFLGLTQLALVYSAQLMVEHAAARAVRAAVVILPDDHEEADYGGVPLNQVGTSGEGLEAYATAPSGGRLAAIGDAARLTLSPVAPSMDSIASSSVAGAISGNGALGLALGALGWNEWAVAVTFVDSEGGYVTSFEPRGPVTARVTFLFRCAVPMARRLMCSSFDDLDSKRREALMTNGGLLAGIADVAGWQLLALEAERTFPNQGI